MTLGRRILIALLIVGLAASGYVAVQRHRTESRNRAVEIVVDWDEVQEIASSTGTSPVDVLKRFKRAGVTSVAVSEQTFQDAMDDGLIGTFRGNSYFVAPNSEHRIVGCVNSILSKRVLSPHMNAIFFDGHVERVNGYSGVPR